MQTRLMVRQYNRLSATAQAAILSSLLMLATSANAALPDAVGTSVTAIQTDATALFGLIFPVIAAVLGLVIVTKLFKRFGNKV